MNDPTLKLYNVYRIEQTGYAEHYGFVITAHSEEEARQLAKDNCGDRYDESTWIDPKKSTCEEFFLTVPEILSAEYRDG